MGRPRGHMLAIGIALVAAGAGLTFQCIKRRRKRSAKDTNRAARLHADLPVAEDGVLQDEENSQKCYDRQQANAQRTASSRDDDNAKQAEKKDGDNFTQKISQLNQPIEMADHKSPAADVRSATEDSPNFLELEPFPSCSTSSGISSFTASNSSPSSSSNQPVASVDEDVDSCCSSTKTEEYGTEEIRHEEVHCTTKSNKFLTIDGVDTSLVELDGLPAEGGFGEVTFYKTKSVPHKRFALKVAKNTPAGHRQMERELQCLSHLQQLQLSIDNVVRVAELTSGPRAMLLMYREETTYFDILARNGNVDPTTIKDVMSGVLTAVDDLHRNGYYHRDIKPENILVGHDGEGMLVDFGLAITRKDARQNRGLGDGTLEYAAPETATCGWTLQAEVYTVFACVVEGLIGRCLFGGKELMTAGEDRLIDVESRRDDSVEEAEECERDLSDHVNRTKDAEGIDETQEHEEIENNAGTEANEESEKHKIHEEHEEQHKTNTIDRSPLWHTEEEAFLKEQLREATSRGESAHINLTRLGFDVGDWTPNVEAASMMLLLGKPSTFYTVKCQEAYGDLDDDEDADMKMGMETSACLEAKRNPYKIFEADWEAWLTGSSCLDNKPAMRAVVDALVVDERVFDPTPGVRPQTTAAAQVLLSKTISLYVEKSTN